ncbi:hypothetical protein DERF_007023 [Dermatophagoides farinae]|uniref:Uncharacterized protein n=1 Tax=Dermatophagoides farinae TaxID=6954 RepID=A0A922L5K9_DERFA|nr:hypothetical protein DERF_007023 [Dermatophagoides farinae]
MTTSIVCKVTSGSVEVENFIPQILKYQSHLNSITFGKFHAVASLYVLYCVNFDSQCAEQIILKFYPFIIEFSYAFIGLVMNPISF